MTRQLATLLQAGLPLVNSLQLLAKEADDSAWRCLLDEISQQVAQGQSLGSDGTVSTRIPRLYPPVVAVGELTGNLEQCCTQLVHHQERQQNLHKSHKSAEIPRCGLHRRIGSQCHYVSHGVTRICTNISIV